MVIIYYDIFYEMKQYVALYPEKLEDLTLNDLRDGCKGGNENGNVDDTQGVQQHFTRMCAYDRNGESEQHNTAQQREGQIHRRCSQQGTGDVIV